MRKILILVVLVLSMSSCKVGRFVYYNFADINDHKIFPTREVKASENPFEFPVSKHPIAPKELNGQSFDDFLRKNNTVAFMIIRNDSIQYENYFHNYNEASVVPSFSMAKSIISILIGFAVDEGLILSVDEPITTYIPELQKNGFDKVTIKHLLQMTSGLKFNESYINPFGDAATFYYGRNLRKSISKMKLEEKPGERFKYVSGDSQLLGLVLERALKDKTVTEYLQQKLWTPLEMEYDASWSLDREDNGLEKTFCCVNARARDFAKIGRLYLNKGNWNGKQILSENWVNESTKVDTSDGSSWNYQYQWWLLTKQGDYMAQGILGQYIYVNPNKNLIIVRLGKNHGNTNWKQIFMSLAEAY